MRGGSPQSVTAVRTVHACVGWGGAGPTRPEGVGAGMSARPVKGCGGHGMWEGAHLQIAAVGEPYSLLNQDTAAAAAAAPTPVSSKGLTGGVPAQQERGNQRNLVLRCAGAALHSAVWHRSPPDAFRAPSGNHLDFCGHLGHKPRFFANL